MNLYESNFGIKLLALGVSAHAGLFPQHALLPLVTQPMPPLPDGASTDMTFTGSSHIQCSSQVPHTCTTLPLGPLRMDFVFVLPGTLFVHLLPSLPLSSSKRRSSEDTDQVLCHVLCPQHMLMPALNSNSNQKYVFNKYLIKKLIFNDWNNELIN